MNTVWVTGRRLGKIYTIQPRPVDPRWSGRDLQKALAWCATAQHLGWDERRAFQVAEALVMEKKLEGITWPYEGDLVQDMETLKHHVETT